MKLVRLSIRRPLTTLMMMVVLIIIGVRAYSLLKIDNLPDIDFPVVAVVIPFRDASPEDVEDLIIEPVEEAVSGIAGIDQLSATAREGVGTVIIQFESEVNGDQAAIDVEREISAIKAQFPAEADEPSIVKADPAAQPILQLVLTGPQSQDRLFDFADDVLTDRLQAISGVASINVAGGRDQEIEVNVDPTRLKAYGVSLGQVAQAIRNSDQSFPVGSIERGRQENTIRSVSRFDTPREIEAVVVDEDRTTERRIYVRNVATVAEGFADETQIIRYNGEDAVNISITKTSDANTVEVANRVYALIDQVTASLPAGAELIIFNDTSDNIRRSVNNVQSDLILAVLITGVVILLFLHTVRTTFIVLLAIPTSIIMTLIVMWGLDFSLNQVTLLALTLIIGNLVDDSIVVLENTERHLEMGKSSEQAAVDGRREILLASLVIASTDVVVYLPVAFMSGIAGQIFFPYGVTIATATLCSLFVGFTLTPMLASKWMKPADEPTRQAGGLLGLLRKLFRPVAYLWQQFIRLWNFGFKKLSALYAATIRLALANLFSQALVVLIGLAALAGGFYLVAGDIVGTEFFPQQDDGQFQVNIEMPPGTNLETTNQAARWVELLVLRNVPEAVAILTNIGTQQAGGFSSASTASAEQATVGVRLVDQLERERSTTAVVNALRPKLDRLPGATISLVLSSTGGPGGSPLVIEVYGRETDRLIDLANEVEAVMETVPGVVDIINTDAARTPETELVVDRRRAIEQELYPAQVANTLRTAISGEKVGEFETGGGSEIDITLRLQEAARETFDQILQLPVSFIEGEPVRLSRVVQVQETQAPSVINRTNRQRTLTVEAGVEGRPAGDVTNDVEAAIRQQIDFPVGYGFRFAGQSESQREVFAQFGQAIALAVILVYVLMVALYQNWLHPLAIMMSLPVATVGSFAMLWVTGSTLNLFSILGIILLIGIATKNAILLIDFTNQARDEEGLSRKAALIEAGRTRFRPILMTSMTLIFALMPLLFAQGAGSVNRRTLAAVVIGGATSSVLLTLILVPVVYNFFDWSGEKITGLTRRIIGLQ